MPASAVVTGFSYLGETRRDRTLVELSLDVTTANGTRRVVHRDLVPIELVDRLRAGSRVGVRIDPLDTSRLVVDWATL
jgi:hypothetical protein